MKRYNITYLASQLCFGTSLEKPLALLRFSEREKSQLFYYGESNLISLPGRKRVLITIIQACAISIVLAVGVTNTVSHPLRNEQTYPQKWLLEFNNLHSMIKTITCPSLRHSKFAVVWL